MNAIRSVFFTLLLVSSAASTSAAATVKYTLDLTVPGEFTLFATTSPGDNGGLVLYSVPLIGNITAVDNRTVNGISGATFGPVGFTDIRSSDSGPDVNPVIGGAQNIVTVPASHRLYGIGQVPGSLDALGIHWIGHGCESCDYSWGVPFRLARGTYSGPPPHINTNHVDLVANVWAEVGSGAAPQATVLVREIPEPWTLALALPAIVAGFARRPPRRPR